MLLRLPEKAPGAWWDAIAATILVSLLIFAAVVFLASSIAPAKFTYISNEPDLLNYAQGLDEDERTAVPEGSFNALAALKTTLADQYTVATHHNRQVNQRRSFRRSVAGLLILASMFFTIFLVARLLLHYIPTGT